MTELQFTWLQVLMFRLLISRLFLMVTHSKWCVCENGDESFHSYRPVMILAEMIAWFKEHLRDWVVMNFVLYILFILGLFASCTSLGSVISSYDMVLVCAASLGSCSWACFWFLSFGRWSKSLNGSSRYLVQNFFWCYWTSRNYILVLLISLVMYLLFWLY